jgi:antitoxin (DNA-binding transcriptional repressor) of toxin-antitoxin stability system
MKTATIHQVPQQWTQILSWLASDEEVQVTEGERVIARIVPSPTGSVALTPDFLARAQSIWGTQPVGAPLSALVHEARGD